MKIGQLLVNKMGRGNVGAIYDQVYKNEKKRLILAKKELQRRDNTRNKTTK